MTTLYEILKKAVKGEVIYTTKPARNVTSAASRTGRKVATQVGIFLPAGATPERHERILRVEVVK